MKFPKFISNLWRKFKMFLIKMLLVRVPQYMATYLWARMIKEMIDVYVEAYGLSPDGMAVVGADLVTAFGAGGGGNLPPNSVEEAIFKIVVETLDIYQLELTAAQIAPFMINIGAKMVDEYTPPVTP